MPFNKLKHPEKAFSLNLYKKRWHSTSVSEVHNWKANSPIEVIGFGIDIFFNDVQNWKAHFPIESIEGGIDTSSNDVQ